MKTTQFQIGQVYQMRFIGDSNLIVDFTCISRTEKFAKFQSKHETIKRRINCYDSVEFVLQGNYSMSPSIKATNIVK